LGLQLVYTLTEQLGGTLELESNGGTAFKLRFTA
jgi:two-component sensor histidine kinase